MGWNLVSCILFLFAVLISCLVCPRNRLLQFSWIEKVYSYLRIVWNPSYGMLNSLLLLIRDHRYNSISYQGFINETRIFKHPKRIVHIQGCFVLWYWHCCLNNTHSKRLSASVCPSCCHASKAHTRCSSSGYCDIVVFPSHETRCRRSCAILIPD